MITAEWLLDSILDDIQKAIVHQHNSSYPCNQVEEDLKAMKIYYSGIKDAFTEGEEEVASTGNDKMNLIYRWIKIINDLALKAGANIAPASASTASKAISEIIGMTQAVMLAVGGNNNE